MSASTFERQRRKTRMFEASLELRADPESVSKRVALEAAIDAYQAVTVSNDVRSAIEKAIRGVNKVVNLAGANDFGDSGDNPRIRKADRGKPSKLNMDGLPSAEVKRVNMTYPDPSKRDFFDGKEGA